jgi:hypothetical protein
LKRETSSAFANECNFLPIIPKYFLEELMKISRLGSNYKHQEITTFKNHFRICLFLNTIQFSSWNQDKGKANIGLTRISCFLLIFLVSSSDIW